MDTELIILILAVVLPLYPALFVIYRKIGEYDIVCAEFWALLEEHDRIVRAGNDHGPANRSNR